MTLAEREETLTAGPGPGPALRVEEVTDAAGLLALEPAWRALAARCPAATVFQSWEWTRAWWEAFGGGRRPLVLVARAEDRVVGIAPFLLRSLGPLRLCELLGAGRTDYLAFLTDPDFPGALPALLGGLRARAGRWDVAWLRDMPLAEGEREALAAAARDAGLGCRIGPWDVAPYLDLDGGWEAYLAGRSANFRSDLKRKRRKLEEAGAVVIERHQAPEAVRAALREAAEIEAHSWKQEAGTARMAEPAGLRFFEAASGALAAAGKTDLWLLRCGEPAVAFYLNFRSGDRVYYYSGTYRQEFHPMSPGKVLMAEVIRAACDEGYTVFDFLRGAEAYKSTWTATARPLTEAFLHSPRPRSRMAGWLLGGVGLPAKRGERGKALVERLQRLRGRLRGG